MNRHNYYSYSKYFGTLKCADQLKIQMNIHILLWDVMNTGHDFMAILLSMQCVSIKNAFLFQLFALYDLNKLKI